MRLFVKIMFVVVVLANCSMFILMYPEFASDGPKSTEAAPADRLLSNKLYLVSETPASFFGPRATKKNEIAAASDGDVKSGEAEAGPNSDELASDGSDLP